MINLSKKEARALVLQQQFPKFSRGQAGVLEAIEHLGYVQVDTISVVERAHHHVLWSRVPAYKAEHLKQLLEVEKKVFDYWAHAASYLSMRDFRFSLYRKEERRQAEADRKNSCLQVKHLLWVEGQEMPGRLQKLLGKFADFCGCEKVEMVS